jgi:hypothetical protein
MSRHNCHPEPRFRAKDLLEYLGLDRFRGLSDQDSLKSPARTFTIETLPQVLRKKRLRMTDFF